ncbi:SHOCT domain-containing protein [Anaerosolibacter sp.]|uniref:SHOCT domain-containing protein n=1 Tax=Anaerosolibacter sp. TaxID=1872527 RepID=UPI0039EF6290
MCGFWGFGYGSGNWIWMGAFSLLRFLVVVALVVWIIKLLSKRSGKHFHFSNSNALDILQERYAKGEISEEDYIQKKRIMTEQ